MANHDNKDKPKQDIQISEETATNVKALSQGDFATVMESLIGRLNTQSNDPGLMALAEQVAGMRKAEARRERHSNVVPTGISVFDPHGTIREDGDDRPMKPKLIADVFFEGHRESDEQLTPAEVDAYNSITSSRETRAGAWQAVFETPRGGLGKPRLSITCGVGIDKDKGLMLPPLYQIITELVTGADATDVVKLLRMVEEQAAQIKALMASRADGRSSQVPVNA